MLYRWLLVFPFHFDTSGLIVELSSFISSLKDEEQKVKLQDLIEKVNDIINMYIYT